MFYLGGLGNYRQKLGEEVAKGYGNFVQRGWRTDPAQHEKSFAVSKQFRST